MLNFFFKHDDVLKQFYSLFNYLLDFFYTPVKSSVIILTGYGMSCLHR